MKPFFLLVILFFTAILLNAQQQECKSSPKIVDQCFKIHGRVRIGNGIGITIWRVGTDRVLGVGDVDVIIPDNLGSAVFKKGDVYSRDVFGDFEVCPFTKNKDGEMQRVCVQSASHLVVREEKK